MYLDKSFNALNHGYKTVKNNPIINDTIASTLTFSNLNEILTRNKAPKFNKIRSVIQRFKSGKDTSQFKKAPLWGITYSTNRTVIPEDIKNKINPIIIRVTPKNVVFAIF